VGILWLIRMQRYFRRIAKDTVLLDSLWQEYAQRVLPKVGLFTIRSLKNAFLVLLGAVLCLVDFYLDSVNVIPDVLAAICFFAFFFLLRNVVSIQKAPLFVSVGLFLFLSVAAEVGDYIFHTYYFFSAHLVEEEMTAFVIKAVLQMGAYLALLFVILQVGRVLLGVIREHTGVAVGVGEVTEIQRNMEAVYQKELRHTLIAVWVGFGIHALTTVLLILKPLLASTLEQSLGFLNPLQWVGVLVLFCAVFRAKDAIYESVCSKYLLE